MNDRAAEERWAACIIDAHLAEVAAGTAGHMISHWFAVLMVEHGSPVTAAREHRRLTRAELPTVLGISQAPLFDVERGGVVP